ncbi:hypothetical protein VB712_05215 [Spirulina sp. CCNP1310]|uniref:hypothetical protein n=1 Tax=Spirulina sp. CCNP1310 TaxID=3110249 RepID=UPI00130860C8|nr:hypothetical protein [Spirulina sp. CCNP1310]MEA5418618.1 hypothetical protein [Spirulina sp. CCNP1310]TVQ58314.1 MAG: hypothetical protein EA366_06830 [Spirulina sp. DLM2.Bin59]
MKLAEIQSAIAQETTTLETKIERRKCILDTYVGDPTRLRIEMEKWKSELEVWRKCLGWIDQVEG